jgi:putative membrane protein
MPSSQLTALARYSPVIPSATIRHMKNFVVKTIANAGALAVAVWLLDKITLTGNNTGKKIGTLIVVALIFGLVNFLVKPILKVLTFPLFILTLGLITLVVNALMLLLTSWVAGKLDLSFHVEGFWTAVLGGLIISIVSWALHVVLPDKD